MSDIQNHLGIILFIDFNQNKSYGFAQICILSYFYLKEVLEGFDIQFDK